MYLDSKVYEGTALIIRSNIKHYKINKFQTEFLQVTSSNSRLIAVEDRSGCITISATYSPPKHTIKKEQYINFFKTLGNRFITAGDYNAKHWGSRLTLSKGHELLKAIKVMNLATLSIGEPTCWSSNNKKTSDLLSFGIIKGVAKNCCCTESCLELSSDHSVIFIINNKIMTKNKSCTLCNAKIDWPYFQELLETILDNSIPLKTEDYITNAVEHFNQTV